MLIYAHRGWHSASAPENSMAAFRRAAADGFGIETDLRTDHTGRLILFHDRLVGSSPVDLLSHAEIEHVAGRAVATFSDLLDANLGVPINLEVKTCAAWIALAPHIKQGLPENVLISSFIHSIAVAAADLHSLDAAYLLASAPAAPDLFPRPGPKLASVVWDFNVIDQPLMKAAREQGFRNIIYGAKTCDEHAMLVELGCDAVITDTPDTARRAFLG